jgi:hypothetical protein
MSHKMSREQLLEMFPFPMVIDNTMREAFWSCPHSFFRSHIQGLRKSQLDEHLQPVVGKYIDLVFGGVLASGLEATKVAYAVEGLSPIQALTKGGEHVIKKWAAEGPLPAPMSRGQEAKTLEGCLMAHHGYFGEWPLDDPMQQLALVNGQPMVEFSGARPIPGCFHPVTGEQLVYAGRFDAVLDRFGVLFGLDDKSTGSYVDSDNWRSQWRLRGQFTGYCWLAQGYGMKMNQFLVHGIQVLKTKCHYAEALVDRADWKIERWLKQLQSDVLQMTEGYLAFIQHNLGEVYMLAQAHPFGQSFGHACNAYNRPCQFLEDICDTQVPDLERFVVERWNPLERTHD